MRLEDLVLLEGWEWKGEIKSFSNIKPGDEITIVDIEKKKGLFFGAAAAFFGHGDAKYAYMLINIDDTFYIPLYPYGVNLLNMDKWTPYGVMVLRYDTLGNSYVVADIPGYLIPIRNKFQLKVGLPKKVVAWFGEYSPSHTIGAYVLYLYAYIYDEDAFRKSLRELYGMPARQK